MFLENSNFAWGNQIESLVLPQVLLMNSTTDLIFFKRRTPCVRSNTSLTHTPSPDRKHEIVMGRAWDLNMVVLRRLVINSHRDDYGNSIVIETPSMYLVDTAEK